MMGTNFYRTDTPERIHLGKRSNDSFLIPSATVPWPATPEKLKLNEMLMWLLVTNAVVEDEYGNEMPPDEFCDLVEGTGSIEFIDGEFC